MEKHLKMFERINLEDKSLINKLVLGTASLGMLYGVNTQDAPTDEEVNLILDYALYLGINEIDTALDYGKAHERIATFEKNQNKHFKIISKCKFENTGTTIDEKFNQCLNSLGKRDIYGFLFHKMEDFKNIDCRRYIFNAKESGRVKKIGVSIYTENEIELVIKNSDKMIDIIQIPFSIFNQSKEKNELLEYARDSGIMIYARSIYLQGLLLKNTQSHWGGLEKLRGPIRELHAICANYSLKVEKICLAYALSQTLIDKVIMGVNSLGEFKNNVQDINHKISSSVIEEIENIVIEDKSLTDPRNWKI